MTRKNRLMGEDFGRRALTSLIGGPLVLAITYVNGLLFTLVVNIAGVLGSFELAHMIRPGNRLTLALVVFTTVATTAALAMDAPFLIPLAIILFLAVGLAETRFSAESDFIRHTIYALLGALYIGLALGTLMLLRTGENGLLWTVMLFINNWSTDSFALIGGRLWGQHKLAPTISPHKTVEGAAVGLTMGFVGGMIVALLGGLPLATAIIANVIVALATEIGDLIESLVKRHLHVKDSGRLLPGHGGVLDRMDGTLLAAPSLLIFFILLGI